MVDREVFDRRLARLEQWLRELRRLAQVERQVFLADARTIAAAERWLQLAAECALDLANHLRVLPLSQRPRSGGPGTKRGWLPRSGRTPALR